MAHENMNRESVVLHYAGIAARALTEQDSRRLDEINHEMQDIEAALGLSKREIMIEAAEVLKIRTQ